MLTIFIICSDVGAVTGKCQTVRYVVPGLLKRVSLSLSLSFCFRWADEYEKTGPLYHGSKVAVISPPSTILDEAV